MPKRLNASDAFLFLADCFANRHLNAEKREYSFGGICWSCSLLEQENMISCNTESLMMDAITMLNDHRFWDDSPNNYSFLWPRSNAYKTPDHNRALACVFLSELVQTPERITRNV